MTDRGDPETHGTAEVSSLFLATRRATAPAAGERRHDFDEVYAENFPFVWRCLRALGVPQALLDDATQDVFVVVHRQLDAFEGRSSVRTWLYGIARKVAFNHRRRQQRKG